MKLKGKVKEGDILTDDVGCTYKVLEVFNNSIVVGPTQNKQNLSCEIMSYEAMDNEKWQIINFKTLPIET